MAKTIKRFTYAVKDKYDNMVTVYARIEKEGGLYYWYTSHLTKPQDADGIGTVSYTHLTLPTNSRV